ncbi:MAG TPA: hypothetical protein VMH05_17410 [Bryobacteraceae bacterium]|nr:hypothetical protein [Bryobacteraceae bacterium]
MGGEFIGVLILGLLDRTGLFELKPPFLLKRKQEFPDCAALLDSRRIARLPQGYAARYVNLCRVTAFAWAAWVLVAAFFLCAASSYGYHQFLSKTGDVLSVMRDHQFLTISGIGPSPAQVTCLAVWYALVVGAVLMAVYYSVLLAACRDSEANLKSLKHARGQAAAT